MRLQSPSIALSHSSALSWSPDWSLWNSERHEPYVVAPGWLVTRGSDAPQILIRVDPRDAVTLGRSVSVDPDGWLPVGDGTDGGLCSFVDPARASTIEYRVVRPDPRSEDVVQLSIEGSNDGDIGEAASVMEFLGEAASVLLGVWFGSWWIGLWIYRWMKQRRSTSSVTGNV